MPTKKLPPINKELKRLLRNYASWYAEVVFIGSRHPDEHTEIRKEFDEAKRELYEYLSELEKK